MGAGVKGLIYPCHLKYRWFYKAASLTILQGHLKVRCVLEVKSVVQELCESRGGRPGLSVLTSLVVSVDVRQY